MMGVELPAQDRELNINLGDRDSVRRRALWALEGKGGADSFAPVEIPVLNTPELERRLFELREYPRFGSPFSSAFRTKRETIANRRQLMMGIHGCHQRDIAHGRTSFHIPVERFHHSVLAS